MGMMMAMGSGTTSSSSGCTDAATATNDQILEMFDLSNYTNLSINVSDGLEQFQVSGILFMAQFD
jgi:hypothetical protein